MNTPPAALPELVANLRDTASFMEAGASVNTPQLLRRAADELDRLASPAMGDGSIRQIAFDALKEMKASGESHEMCARWISERVNSTLSSRPNARLVEALKPLAMRASRFSSMGDTHPVIMGIGDIPDLTVGHLRRAAALLAEIGGME